MDLKYLVDNGFILLEWGKTAEAMFWWGRVVVSREGLWALACRR